MENSLFTKKVSFILLVTGLFSSIVGLIPSNNLVFADVFTGDDNDNLLVGTPEDDAFDSKGGDDANVGDKLSGDSFGNDAIVSGEGDDFNLGDSLLGDGFGNDVLVSGEGDDTNAGESAINVGSGNDIMVGGNGDDLFAGADGKDIFVCGFGTDRIIDFNPSEDIQSECEIF